MITTLKSPNQDEQSEIAEFARTLERRINDLRDAFSDSADFPHERRQNDEVSQRENRGDREFGYLPAIVELTLKLAELGPEKRREIMKVVQTGIRYTVKGIYMSRINDIPGHNTEPLLSDFAQDPTKYVS